MHSTVQQARVEDSEFRLLLEGLRQCYGFDFEGYDRAWLERRVWARVLAEGVETLSGLQDRVLHHAGSVDALLQGLVVAPPRFFSEPRVFKAFLTHAVPVLRTYPSIAVWVPACGAGHDAYAVAILLHEAGLLGRAQIYATDVSEAVYRAAKDGRVPVSAEDFVRAEADYRKAGGRGVLSEYLLKKDEEVLVAAPLRRAVVFLEHQLSTDGVFHEFETVVAPHLWPVLGPALQARVLRLVRDSLGRFGLLAGGPIPGLEADESCDYEPLDEGRTVYRKSGRLER
ncbi:CheR family methyltransferase [Candidatus Nitrospira bockiana]